MTDGAAIHRRAGWVAATAGVPAPVFAIVLAVALRR